MTNSKILGINWETKKAKVADLTEWEKNPRKITADEYGKLVEDIRKFGFHDVLKVDHDGTIISGHQRTRALRELGIEEVTVLYPERALTEREKEVIAVVSNRHRGTFDFDLLANEFDLESLREGGFQEFELSFADTESLAQVDTDTLTDSANSYLDGNMKQVTLYFSNQEFEELIPRLDQAMSDTGTPNHTELFLALVKEHEDHTSN